MEIFLVLLFNISSEMYRQFQKSCYYLFEIHFERHFTSMLGKGKSSQKAIKFINWEIRKDSKAKTNGNCLTCFMRLLKIGN